ncbi:MAG: transporter substrate-binding domain-containing protein [Pseudomonadota bacterium]
MHARILFVVVAVLVSLLLSACQSESTEPETPSTEIAQTLAEPTDPDPADVTQMAAAEAVPEPEPCTLTAGWDPWEPYHYIAAGSEVRGLDIEMIEAIANLANCEVSFEQGNWSGLLNQLRNGNVDVMMGATQIPERENFAHFSEPYREDSFMLYILQGEEERVGNHSLEELMQDGFRIGITQGYYYGAEFDELQMRPELADQIVDVSVGEMNFTHLLDGRIDGFLEHSPVATAIKRRRGDTDPIVATELSIGGGPVTFMFSRESVDQEIVQRFNDALQELKDSGEHERMLSRYME